MATTLRADDDRVLLEKLTISRPSAARNQEIHEHRDNKKMETTWPAMPNIQVKILGKLSSPLGYMIRDFLQRSDIPFQWVDLKNDGDAQREAGVASLNDSRLPVCVFSDGARLECPTLRQLSLIHI